MRIAVPVTDNLLSRHFGQSSSFALFDVDPERKTIVGRRDLTPPDHGHGVYPRWLAEQQVTLVLAGGMGSGARDLLAANRIEVVLGAESIDPEAIVNSYLAGHLVTGQNACDHGNGTCHH